jgi:hypothetical protein
MESATRHSASVSWREIAVQDIAKAEQLAPIDSPWSPHPPSRKAVERARALIDAIKIELPIAITSASPEGTICLQWRERDRKLAFFVHEDGQIEFFGRTSSRPSPVEGEVHRLEEADEIVRLVFP